MLHTITNVFQKVLDESNHKPNKMKPVVVKSSLYIDFGKKKYDKDSKFKFGDHVKISKHKNFFAKGYIPNWSKEVFAIKKIKNTVSLLVVIKAKKLLERFMKKNCKK